MIIGTLEFNDPDDFRITPRSTTNTRRALSGKVYGSKTIKRDELEISFETLTHAMSEALLNYLYEATPSETLNLSFDVFGCKDAFSGTVEYVDYETSSLSDPNFSRDLAITFKVHA